MNADCNCMQRLERWSEREKYQRFGYLVVVGFQMDESAAKLSRRQHLEQSINIQTAMDFAAAAAAVEINDRDGADEKMRREQEELSML